MKTFKQFLAESQYTLKGEIVLQEDGLKSKVSADLVLNGTGLSLQADFGKPLVFKNSGDSIGKDIYDKKVLVERELAKARTKQFRMSERIIKNMLLAFNKPKIIKDAGKITYKF